MLLNVWTKLSGYNLGETPNVGPLIPAGKFIAGNQYVIVTPGNTNWTDIGATASTVGTVFTATKPGTGNGSASKTIVEEHTQFYAQVPANPIPGIRYPIFPLPTQNDTGVSYSVISGDFPRGLRIEGNKIIGSPFEISRDIEYNFCIRAKKGTDISDRTFKLTITGPNPPEFITAEGDLGLVVPNQYFVLDKTFVDYQIEAIDQDTAAGQKLSYFIAKGDGELPPGLSLTQDGRITGFIQPVLAIKPEDGDGTYDNSYYDAVAYDFANVPTNGYDTYVYDNLFYDFNLPTSRVRKLNRYYEFIVTLTDGDSITKRKFRVLVIGDDFFRADNALLQVGFQKFTADGTFLRPPVWSTPTNLGYYRGNNYLTVKLDVFNSDGIIYDFELVNADINAQTFQIAKTDNILYSTSLTCKADTIPKAGQYLTFAGKFDNAISTIYQISQVIDLSNNYFRLFIFKPDDPTNPIQGLDNDLNDDVKFLIGTRSILPPGMDFDRNTGDIFGKVPYVPAITQTFNFSATASNISTNGELAFTSKKFIINIIGEIDSVLTWNTDPDLGTINANFISTLSVKATSTIPESVILYRVTSGRLPPGLTLELDGEITGMVNQFFNPVSKKPGIIRFKDPNGVTTFDNGETTVDRSYTFTVQATDQYNLLATERAFTISIDTPNQLTFSNIKVKAFLKQEQRTMWKNFINDTTIFTPTSIYRPNDINFGVQQDLSMLVYAGIETVEAAKYISAMGLNHKRKRFHFGAVEKAVAYLPGTKTPVYEVIYVKMIDPLEPNGKRLANKIKSQNPSSINVTTDISSVFWQPGFSPKTDPVKIAKMSVAAPRSERPENIISVDSTAYIGSDNNPNTYYPSSISNWRDRIKYWKDNSNTRLANERNYLPLWMRSIQPGTTQELDFQLAIPLCYCKIGTADDILLNIKYSEFDFKLLDYTAERYIIDAVEGSTGDKYLVFRNDRITI